VASVVETMTFEEWCAQVPPDGLRIGQHLFNTAPPHIRKMTTGVLDLDPFYNQDGRIETLYILNNFLTFAQLCWDVTDGEELALARQMVMSEPNARR
jgi:hypothetical protein